MAATHSKALQIYFIDVEGGQATLVVTPQGESMLIDAGFPSFEGRDASRIATAAKDAGVERLDYVLITHYHRDHAGGVVQISERLRVGTFLDRGPNQENSAPAREGYNAYEKFWAGAEHRVVKPGDHLALPGADIQVVAAADETLTHPLTGAGEANPFCASEPRALPDSSENAQSVGILLTYGNFRFLDLGDLPKQKELALVCPNDRIGPVDLYLTTHHGLDQSNARALVHQLHPRVAIMNNGPHKGGSPQAWETVHNSPGLQDLWQLRFSIDSDAAHCSDNRLIANTDENCEGHYLRVSATTDGTFFVVNSGNQYSRTYKNDHPSFQTEHGKQMPMPIGR